MDNIDNKKQFKLINQKNNITLRTISEKDIEKIRVWKNEHRSSFFFQDIISPENQIRWFRKYLSRGNDFVFIVSYTDKDIGCIAFRELDEVIDIYNVILGDKSFGGKGYMSIANSIMCSYIIDNFKKDITVKVLKTNPAIKWYLKNNFLEIDDTDNYLLFKLDYDNFKKIDYKLIKY